jgi:hypothetical protein
MSQLCSVISVRLWYVFTFAKGEDMDLTFLTSREAKTYNEKFIKGTAATSVILTAAWIGLSIAVPKIGLGIFFGGLIMIAATALFVGLFIAWDG